MDTFDGLCLPIYDHVFCKALLQYSLLHQKKIEILLFVKDDKCKNNFFLCLPSSLMKIDI